MELDIKNFKIQDSTKCKCGYEFVIQDMTDLRRIDEHGFYANIVKHCSFTRCPKCNQETLLLLRQKGQTWEILNTAISKEIETKIEEPQNENKEEKTEGQEFICPECQKVCKNKIGLNAHMKTHQK